MIATKDQDHSEDSLPSIFMEEEKKSMYHFSRRHKDNSKNNGLTLSHHHFIHVMSCQGVMSRCYVKMSYQSSFSTSFVDYVVSIFEKFNVKWKSKSHP